MTLHRPNPHALARLAHAMLVALALLVVGPNASAASPMCSEDGRSIVAPPVLRPGSAHVLESQGDCERLRELLGNSSPGNDHPGSVAQGDAPLRAVPARMSLPSAPRSARLAVVVVEDHSRPGMLDELLRPPRR